MMAASAFSVLLVELLLNVLYHPQVNIAKYLRNAVGGYELPEDLETRPENEPSVNGTEAEKRSNITQHFEAGLEGLPIKLKVVSTFANKSDTLDDFYSSYELDIDPDKDDPEGNELNELDISKLEDQREQALLDHAVEVKEEKLQSMMSKLEQRVQTDEPPTHADALTEHAGEGEALKSNELLATRDPLDSFYDKRCRDFYTRPVLQRKGLGHLSYVPKSDLRLHEGCWKVKMDQKVNGTEPVDRWMTWEDVHMGVGTEGVGKCSGENYRNVFVDGSYLRGVHVHISLERKFIAPCIWKSGSTTLSSMTQKLGARKPNDPRVEFKDLVGGSLNYTAEELSSFYSFAFVRDPITRLLSAYRTVDERMRALAQNGRQGSLNGANDRRYKHLAENSEFIRVHREPDRFRAFVRDIARGLHFHSAEHILTQMYFLTGTTKDGKQLRYDFIGRLENLDEDWKRVLEIVELSGSDRIASGGKAKPLPAKNKGGAISKEDELLDDTTIRTICEMYAQDYICLGYPLPQACSAVSFDLQ